MVKRFSVGSFLFQSLFLLILFSGPSPAAAALNLVQEFSANAGNSQFGWRALLADTDGDGASEIGVTARLASPDGINRTGSVYLYRPDGELIQRLDGHQPNELFGEWAIAKDLNNDGKAELIVGAPGYSTDPNGQNREGAVYLYSNGENGLVEIGHLIGSEPQGCFGRVISTILDLDDDGADDLLIGAPCSLGNKGALYIVSGKKGHSGASMRDALIKRWNGDGSAESGYFASCMAGLGDLDGDGVPDFAISTATAGPLENGIANAAGVVWVFSGGKVLAGSSFNDATLFKIHGEQANDWLGNVVVDAGDLDGDDITDILVGAPGRPSNQDTSGSVYLYSGKKAAELGAVLTPLNAALLTEISGEKNGDAFGYSVSNVGDVNGDTLPDFAVGASLADVGECGWVNGDPAPLTADARCDAGKIYVYSITLSASDQVITRLIDAYEGATRSGRLGHFVSGKGTVQGHPALMAGAPFINDDTGLAFLLSSDDVVVEASSEGGSSPAGSSDTGPSVSTASATSMDPASSAASGGAGGFGCSRSAIAATDRWDRMATFILLAFPFIWSIVKRSLSMMKPIGLILTFFFLFLSARPIWGAGNQVNKTLTVNTGMGVSNGTNRNMATNGAPGTQCAGLGAQVCEGGPFADTSNPFEENHDCSPSAFGNTCSSSFDPALPAGFALIDNRFGRGAPCGPNDTNGPPFPYPCHTEGSVNHQIPLGINDTIGPNAILSPPSLGVSGQPFYQFRSNSFGNLRVNRIEYGFDQNVRAEGPQIFRIFFTVDSTTDSNGQLVGNAVGTFKMTISDGSGANCNVTTTNPASEGQFESGSTGVITCIDRNGNLCQGSQFNPGKFAVGPGIFRCP